MSEDLTHEPSQLKVEPDDAAGHNEHAHADSEGQYDGSDDQVVDNVLDRLMKQERELEKMELKVRAYERIFKANKEKLKSYMNNINESQNAAEIQTAPVGGATPIDKRYRLVKKSDATQGEGGTSR